MEVVYISGAYRSDTKNGVYENIQKARKVALKYWKLGYAVICPHMNTAFMDGACSDDTWLNGDLELLRRSDIVVMMPGWQDSAGAKEEHSLVMGLDKMIIYEKE